MILNKVKYKLSQLLKFVSTRAKGFEINWSYWGITFASILGILILSANIFRIVRKGYERYDIIQQEKERLEKLLEKNAELTEELKYYSSSEFVDIKAREELNMAFPNQRLIYIEKHEPLFLDEDDEQNAKENLEPGWRLWYDLIF
jgi:cell division protein FtsB